MAWQKRAAGYPQIDPQIDLRPEQNEGALPAVTCFAHAAARASDDREHISVGQCRVWLPKSAAITQPSAFFRASRGHDTPPSRRRMLRATLRVLDRFQNSRSLM